MTSHSLLLFAALLLPSTATSQQTSSSWTPPGLLESFLSKTPNATVNKKLLGVLGGPAAPKATFTAIVAEDPSHPGATAKGIEIELEATTQKSKVYLDDDHSADSCADNLTDFASALNQLAQEPIDKIFKSPNSKVVTTGAHNRPADSAVYCCPRYPAFNAGWYRRGDELGVRIDTAGKPPGVILHFPNENLTTVVDLITAAKAWLDAN